MPARWTPAARDDQVADNVRALSAAFLRRAEVQGLLPPGTQFPQDVGCVAVYKSSAERPFYDRGVLVNYVWYKAVPGWHKDDRWVVRVDHFMVNPCPAAMDVLVSEHGPELKPITFFTTKTMLPGEKYTYDRFDYDVEKDDITVRIRLGFLDPTAMADVNVGCPYFGEAFVTAPIMHDVVIVTPELSHGEELLGVGQFNVNTAANNTPDPYAPTLFPPGGFILGSSSALEDPFGGSGHGSATASAHADLPPPQPEELMKRLAKATRKLKLQDEVMRTQSMQIESLKKGKDKPE